MNYSTWDHPSQKYHEKSHGESFLYEHHRKNNKWKRE